MVYVEVLVIIDLFMNYIILTSISIILNRITKFKKIFLASTIGTIPLVFLFINIDKRLINIITILFSFLISTIAFNYKNLLYTIKNIIYMYLISIFIAGSIFLINTNFLPQVNNYILRIIILIITTPIITYIYIKSTNKIKIYHSNYYKIDIYLKDKPRITINSFLDTGNKLIDPYTNTPIILISKKVMKYNYEKFILVPYNTIDNHGLLKCFYPEKIHIEKVGDRKKVLIAIIDEIGIADAECILNQKLLERI